MNKRSEYTVVDDGGRLDTFLAGRNADLSRSRIQRLIDDGYVTVDDRPAKSSQKVISGQIVVLGTRPPSPTRLRPQDIPLSAVHEDEDIIVIDKPAGMTVHPSPGHEDWTLANAVLAYAPDIEGVGGEHRPGIVHRLDKDTSGLIVVAKHERAHANLSKQFEMRTVKKMYLALVVGHPSPEEADVDGPIGRHPNSRQQMAIVSKGRAAITRYRVVQTYMDVSLVEARPKTGRTHQIRVHMASIGHPVVGDTTYGNAAPGLPRQFLHAYQLGFQHPITSEGMEFTSELPDELRSYLNTLSPHL
jgi:23S rRNA pseudouridine1911/1915/1917 synthase